MPRSLLDRRADLLRSRLSGFPCQLVGRGGQSHFCGLLPQKSGQSPQVGLLPQKSGQSPQVGLSEVEIGLDRTADPGLLGAGRAARRSAPRPAARRSTLADRQPARSTGRGRAAVLRDGLAADPRRLGTPKPLALPANGRRQPAGAASDRGGIDGTALGLDRPAGLSVQGPPSAASDSRIEPRPPAASGLP
jgi:hypothetical protein